MAIKIYNEVELDKIDEFKQNVLKTKVIAEQDKSISEKIKALADTVETQNEILQELILKSYEA